MRKCSGRKKKRERNRKEKQRARNNVQINQAIPDYLLDAVESIERFALDTMALISKASPLSSDESKIAFVVDFVKLETVVVVNVAFCWRMVCHLAQVLPFN